MHENENQYRFCPYLSSGALAREIDKMAQKAWKPLGLSPGLAYLLMFIIDYPYRDNLILSQGLTLSPAMITRMIRKLEKKKLVTTGWYDGHKVICPTTEAAHLENQLLECHRTFSKNCRLALGLDKDATLMEDIRKAADKLMEITRPRGKVAKDSEDDYPSLT